MNSAVVWLEDRFDRRWRATGGKNWLRDHDVYEYYADAPAGSVCTGSMFELKLCSPPVEGMLSSASAHQCAGPFDPRVSTFRDCPNTELVTTLCPHGYLDEYTRLVGDDE